MLDLKLPLGQLLKVLDDGLGGQVVESLIPDVFFFFFLLALVFSALEEGAKVEGYLPVDRFAVLEPLHQGLAERPSRPPPATTGRGTRFRSRKVPIRGGFCFKVEGRMLGRLCKQRQRDDRPWWKSISHVRLSNLLSGQGVLVPLQRALQEEARHSLNQTQMALVLHPHHTTTPPKKFSSLCKKCGRQFCRMRAWRKSAGLLHTTRRITQLVGCSLCKGLRSPHLCVVWMRTLPKPPNTRGLVFLPCWVIKGLQTNIQAQRAS